MYRRKFAFQNRLGQLVLGRKFTICIRGQIPSTSPRGAYIRRGDLKGGFFALRFWWAYIWRGFYMEGLIFGILRACHTTEAHLTERGSHFCGKKYSQKSKKQTGLQIRRESSCGLLTISVPATLWVSTILNIYRGCFCCCFGYGLNIPTFSFRLRHQVLYLKCNLGYDSLGGQGRYRISFDS